MLYLVLKFQTSGDEDVGDGDSKDSYSCSSNVRVLRSRVVV